MSARPRYVPNPAATKQIGLMPSLAAELAARTEPAKAAAQAVSPYLTGEYRDSIRVSTGIDEGTVVAVLSAGAPHSEYIEFGTSDTPIFAPLRKGMEASGLRGRM